MNAIDKFMHKEKVEHIRYVNRDKALGKHNDAFLKMPLKGHLTRQTN